jgi:hypothetical protein
MRKMMAAGGLMGFGVGTVCGLIAEGSSWPGILVRASIASLIGGILLRWWAGVYGRCVAEAHAERQAARDAQNPPSPLLERRSVSRPTGQHQDRPGSETAAPLTPLARAGSEPGAPVPSLTR